MFGEDSTTLSKMYHLIDSVDITRTVCNFLQRTKLIYFFKYLCMYIYIYIYIYILYNCFAFLFRSVNPFSKQQNFSPNQQSLLVTFIAAVSLFWSSCLV